MESNIKRKRGRPATGRRMDGVLFVRIPKDIIPEAKDMIKNLINGQKPSGPVDSDQSLMWKKAFDQSEIEIDRLRKQIESSKIKSDNEVVAALSSENDKLKAKVKEYEQMYG